MRKRIYETPHIEIIEVENEGSIMTGSVNGVGLPGYGGGGGLGGKATTRSNNIHSTSAFSELEDLINDILTVKK